MLPERFWVKVDKSGDCWLWTGATNQSGYGRIGWEGKVAYAHRLVYMDEYGDIPKGLEIDHLCRVRGCVRVGHMELVTRRENLLRGNTVASRNASKKLCKYGHRFSGVNSEGKRVCNTCNARRQREWYARHHT